MMKSLINLTIGENLIEDWIRFSDISESSIKTYKKSLRIFFNYLKEREISCPTADTVYEFKESLKTERRSPSTINLYLSVTKLFFKFLSRKGIYHIEVSHIKGLKLTSEHKRDALTAQQGKEVLNYFDTTTEIGLRDRAMTAVMLVCGLRTVEVSRANVEDLVTTYGRTALYVQGKGRTDRRECVMLPEKVVGYIEEYLQKRGNTADDSPLFAGIGNQNKNGRLTTDTISKIVKRTFKSVGFRSKRLTAHSLRHSAATAMLLAGVPLSSVQQVLRHKNINTTMIYAHHLDRLRNYGEDKAAEAFCG